MTVALIIGAIVIFILGRMNGRWCGERDVYREWARAASSRIDADPRTAKGRRS